MGQSGGQTALMNASHIRVAVICATVRDGGCAVFEPRHSNLCCRSACPSELAPSQNSALCCTFACSGPYIRTSPLTLCSCVAFCPALLCRSRWFAWPSEVRRSNHVLSSMRPRRENRGCRLPGRLAFDRITLTIMRSLQDQELCECVARAVNYQLCVTT